MQHILKVVTNSLKFIQGTQKTEVRSTDSNGLLQCDAEYSHFLVCEKLNFLLEGYE
jgi:hypothetical protein